MKAKIFILFIVTIFTVSCNQNTQKNNNEQVKNEISQNSNLKLQIYYFHATHRCPTCKSIEANVKNVLDSNFKVELEEGIINFKVINVDNPENQDIAEKYQAFGSALHLVKIENGIENDNDLTNYAFTYSYKQPQEFKKSLVEVINNLIK